MMTEQTSMFIIACITFAASVIPLHGSELVSVPLIPQYVQRARHLTELGIESNELDDLDHAHRRAEAVETSAVYNGYGTHYVDLWCGTPPQRQTVIVDTGSSRTAFPCSDCDRCGALDYHIDDFFNQAESSTFTTLPCKECDDGQCDEIGRCTLWVQYEEESYWRAYKVRDRCYVGGPHNAPLLDEVAGTESIDPTRAKELAIDLEFGCQTKVAGLFKTQLADGILGMSDKKWSFWSQMYDSNNAWSKKQFSLCFSRPLDADRGGTEAGAMTLGGTDKRLHESPMVFASRTSKRSDYQVHVRKVYVRNSQGGESAQSLDPNVKAILLDVDEDEINHGGIIVDSGTTDTYFASALMSKLHDALHECSGIEVGHGQLAIEPRQLEAMPTVLIQLEGDEELNKALGDDPSQIPGLAGDLDSDHPYDIILAIPPSHYMELDASGKYLFRFYGSGNGGALGANAMMGHDVLFDLDNQVIGWAESHCDYHGLVTDNGYTDPLAGPSEHSVSLPDSSINSSAFDAEEIQAQFQGMADACESWYCRGGSITALLVLFCLGCCLGTCCCQSRSASASNRKTQAEANKKTMYHDDPVDDEYGEFELT